MILTDVCRLCLAKDNLVWIFDKRFENSQNMKDVIFTTTGVEIHMKDVISQKICKKCCEIAVKMLQFRTKSLENNLHLKELFKEYLKNGTVKIPNTNVTIKSEKNESKKEDKPIVSKSSYKVHTSVQSLFKVYPQIKIPTKCLEFHIDPHVFMTMDSVENYFMERKIDMNKHIQLALRSNREPKKHQVVEDEITDKGSYKQTDSRPEKLTKETTKINDSDRTSHKSNMESNKDGAKIKPINIKINTDNVICKIIKKNIVQEDTGDHKTNKIMPTNETAKFTHCKQKENISKIERVQGSKRKLSETDPTEVQKPTFIKSLELIQKTNDTAETMYVDKSVPLYICDICNSVQYNSKDLKRHQFKHLRCQFCKAKFRTMDHKTQHLASFCPIKNIMNNLPTVLLEKIEIDKEVRIKYRDAFIDFPPIPGIDLTIINDPESLKSEQIKLNQQPQKSKRKKIEHITADNSSMEVIEILSDDDRETDSSNSKAKKICTTVNTPANSPVTPVSTTPSTNTNSRVTPVSTILTNHTNSSVTVSGNVATTLTTTPVALASPLLSNSNENIVYNTVSIVKPDIKIKNNGILDKFDSKDSDIKVMKELLSDQKIVYSTKEAFVQTDSPSNERIVINQVDFTCDLLFLKHQLHMYTIPVKVKNGIFQVSYTYENVTKKMKKMCLWNDLSPTEIKITKNTAIISSAPNIQAEVNISSHRTTHISSGIPQKHAAIGSHISSVNSNSTVPVTAIVANLKDAQIPNVTSAVPKKITKKIKSSSLINLPYGNVTENVCSTTLPTSTPSSMKINDRSGQNTSNAVKVYKNKMLTPTSSVNSTPLTMNIGLGPGQNIAGITANHQNQLVVPVTSGVSTTVVLNGTMKQNMNFTTPVHNINNHNIMLSPVSSVCTPLTGNVRSETNIAVTYRSNYYNNHYTTPVTTSASISNFTNTLPPIPVNNVTHSNPKVLSESSMSSMPSNLPNASNHILNNYICNPNVSGHASNSLATNDGNPKPGAIRVKNVWELK